MAEFDRTPDGQVVEVRRTSNPMGWLIALLVIVVLVVAAFAFGLIKIGQTQDAQLPDVKVSASGGQAPKFDVQTAKVDVGTKDETIKVPTVGTKDADIKVPTVSMQKADEPAASK